MDSKKPLVQVSENGPYIAKNIGKIKNSKGEKIESKEVVALCRCGASKNKPFCDGTHGKVGFSGKLETGRSTHKRISYVGNGIKILDNRGVCSHAGVCTSMLASVWDNKKEPWINAKGAEKEKIIKVIKQCPSGALSYELNGRVNDEQDREAAIFVSKDGPLQIMGYIELKDEINSKPDSKEHYTLCRCGASKNKPFCDGSHWSAKFKDGKN
jgi:CDGSH-type Zn-finger protein